MNFADLFEADKNSSIQLFWYSKKTTFSQLTCVPIKQLCKLRNLQTIVLHEQVTAGHQFKETFISTPSNQ